MKRYKKLIVAVVFLALFLVFMGASRRLEYGLQTQTLWNTWDKKGSFAQVTCLFSDKAGFTEDQILPIEYQLKEKLQDAAVDVTEGNGRALVDAYSKEGSLYVASSRGGAQFRAYGVGGDFFLFHPLQLLDGSYFNSTDLNEDGILLDEEVAWTLFGSNYVTGMPVDIAGRTYLVRGVVRSDKGMFSKAAAEDVPTVYVALDVMQQQEEAPIALDSYELLIANPVKQFGYRNLQEQMQGAVMEGTYEVVENSTRYGFFHRFEILKNFGKRSMNTKGIIYPYWENRARGYEDVSALLLVFEFICIIYPIIYGIQLLCMLFKKIKQLKIFNKKRQIN